MTEKWVKEVYEKILTKEEQVQREMHTRYHIQRKMVYLMIRVVKRSAGGPMDSGAV